MNQLCMDDEELQYSTGYKAAERKLNVDISDIVSKTDKIIANSKYLKYYC